MNERIVQALTRLFDKHRIIFWYDSKQELRQDYETLTLPGVEKVELGNNAFGLKYQLLRNQPEQKFLLYREGAEPPRLENWLLDVQLAHGEFRTDQVALWLDELDLSLDFVELAESHAEFFQAIKRREALKKLLKPQDTATTIQLKMLAVCAGSEPRLDSLLENLLQELADGRDERYRLVQRCQLAPVLWLQLQRSFGYISDSPGLRDFVVELFKSCYAMSTGAVHRLSADALVFLKRWKDSRIFTGGFEKLADECSTVLGMEQDLARRDFRDLLELDYFWLIDQKILAELVRGLTERHFSSAELTQWIRLRRQGHWYPRYQDLYEAIDYGGQFIQLLGETVLTLDSLADGIQRYSNSWFRLDQLYRKFVYHTRKSSQPSLMAALSEQIENLYTNNFLLKVNNLFQVQVDATLRWEAPPVLLQRHFFEECVQPFLRKEIKVCVIISDALRYEIGEELLTLIRREDRYNAELEPALAQLPSYTQLGMAALLPHRQLTLTANDSGTVLVDGVSSQGTGNRSKVLKGAVNDKADAVTFEDFMALQRDDSRELLKNNDVLYLYHNRIDHTGDKMHSEGQAFDAAETTLDELVKLVKKLTASNASNILITADHGFIYQQRPLDSSDFSSVDATGDQILYRDRRFVLGKGLKPSPALRSFSVAELGLAGDVDVQIPKSIHRLRLSGSGSRFVHGGASLQEVVIPVLRINKKRQSDVSVVDVEILRGATTVITSGQLAVTLYQTEAVTDKVQARTLRVGLYTEAGDLISDSHTVVFDRTSDNPRERELPLRFVLSRKADAVNNSEVLLRLEEQHAGTSHYVAYKTLRYLMRRSFTTDFDF